jgi:lipopolysaccharide/colanic/teichoic acid biosynthesis glycosyltransferase
MTTRAPAGDRLSGASWWLRLRLAGLDRIAAAVLALVLSPLVAVLAVSVRREDGGPAFVRVQRVGRNGVVFDMWKLRSMRADGPGGRAAGAPLTGARDRRITATGARLRQHHLDEIPQLLNVVRGEMLLMGPRPEAPPFVDTDDPGWQAVLLVPPGIAGPTQLITGDWERRHIADDPAHAAYRHIVVPAKLAIDGWYVSTATPLLDILTLLALGQRIAGRPGPSRMERRAHRARPDVIDRITIESDHPDAELRGQRRTRRGHGPLSSR